MVKAPLNKYTVPGSGYCKINNITVKLHAAKYYACSALDALPVRMQATTRTNAGLG
jgi:hypothetical protein